jgi:hypothetical protein
VHAFPWIAMAGWIENLFGFGSAGAQRYSCE